MNDVFKYQQEKIKKCPYITVLLSPTTMYILIMVTLIISLQPWSMTIAMHWSVC